MKQSRRAKIVGAPPDLTQLRDLAPAGVCDPPNPWIYEQLARLCGRSSEEVTATHPHFAWPHSEDLDERPYFWDLKEDDCTCR